MSLPAAEQQVLTRIEQILQSRDPRLKSLFATFTSLTRHDPMPAIEQIRRTAWWLRSSIIIPATLILIGGIIAVAALTGLTRACGPVRPAPGTVSSAGNSCHTQAVSTPSR